MALKILEQSVDGVTGYITVRVQAVDEICPKHVSPEGAVETLIIDPTALMLGFHDPETAAAPTQESMRAAIEAWLAHHHDAVLGRKRRIDHARLAASTITGRTLFVRGSGSNSIDSRSSDLSDSNPTDQQPLPVTQPQTMTSES